MAGKDDEELLRSVALQNARSILLARQRAEDALREQREWFRVTLSSIGDAVIATDIEGRVTFLNPVGESLTGWTDSEAKGQPLDAVFRIVNEETRKAVENPARRALNEGTIAGLANHTVLIAKDGKERPIDDSAAPIRGKEGEVVGCVLVFRDITERRRLERENAEQMQGARLLASIVESSNDAIISKSLDGIIQTWNAAAQRLFAYTAEQAVGRHISLLIPADRAGEEDRIIAHLRAGERVEHFDTVRVRSDGQRVHVSLTISPVRDETGRVVGASKIVRDITEKKRLEDELRKYAADLREADRHKNEFLAMLAHELRNPLAPIRNAVQFLRLTSGDGKAVASTSEMLERQVGQLVRLVDDLLDVSRISRGKVELRKERVELVSVVNHAVEAACSAVQCMEHDLTVTVPRQPIYLNADPTRLAQVVGNLLNNACKFTDKGRRISLTVEREGEQAVIRVRDTGIGIATDQLPRIFDLFMQVDTSLERSTSGLGIGLTLVKNLVEKHDGTVEVRSGGIGQGSEFVVRLPIMVETAKLAPPELTVREATPTKARRILVVDDNRDSATSLAMLLKLTGHETHTAYDGLEAVEKAATFKPDVVLLDIGLPKLNGYEACRRIREQPCGKNMVLVALTGWGQEEDRQRSRDAGFNGHLMKPVDLDVLTKLLAEAGAG
jgi:PAS domain S-box-containing protein